MIPNPDFSKVRFYQFSLNYPRNVNNNISCILFETRSLQRPLVRHVDSIWNDDMCAYTLSTRLQGDDIILNLIGLTESKEYFYNYLITPLNKVSILSTNDI